MYEVRPAMPRDTQQIAKLLFSAIEELYPDRRQKSIFRYELQVASWVANHKIDVIVVTYNEAIVGFVVGTYDNFYNLLKDYYFVPLIYVTPAKRKSRAAYKLYEWLANRAAELNCVVEAIALNEETVTNSRRFGARVIGSLVSTSQFIKEKHG